MKINRLIVAIALFGVTLSTGILIGSNWQINKGDTNTVVVATPARAGAVEGTSQNSDEFMWRLFVGFVAPLRTTNPSPVIFETWASDKDTFKDDAKWPDALAPKQFQPSQLLLSRYHFQGPIDEACRAPTGKNPINAPVGGFPVTGNPTPCIAEEVKRNSAMFDYIVSNSLNTKEGRAAAFKKGTVVDMPTASIAVKGDWVPLPTLLQWIPQLRDLDQIRKTYYTNISDGVEYALVSLHVASRQNTNWVWATFEHQMSPGRCDDLGCFDTFGAVKSVVPPVRRSVNTQYGLCEKTSALKNLMIDISSVWNSYCLKSTQVDYLAPDGTPYALGNSVIERIVGNGTVAASSCMACHAYASFGEDGKVADAAAAMLPYNPMGPPIPAVLEGSRTFSFMWGLITDQ